MLRVMVAALCCAVAAPVRAQTDSGVYASVAVSAATIGKGTPVALSGGIGYRLTPVFGFGAEVTIVPSLTPRIPRLAVLPAAANVLGGPVRFEEDGGHAVLFTTNVKLEWPAPSSRVLPYLIGGGGVGLVSEHIRSTISFPSPSPPGLVMPLLYPTTTDVTFSDNSTDLALTIGGGVSILTRPKLSVDIEGRYVSLLGRRDFHVGRFGAGITYRF